MSAKRDYAKARRNATAREITRANRAAERDQRRIARQAQRNAAPPPPSFKQLAELEHLSRELGQDPPAAATSLGASHAIGGLRLKLDAARRRAAAARETDAVTRTREAR